MKKVFDEVNSLDKRCYEQLNLSEDILMEHAANAINQFIRSKFSAPANITIVSGAGNNGADGIALARQLTGAYNVTLCLPYGTQSAMAIIQHQRAQLANVTMTQSLDGLPTDPDIIVDCLFGTGLTRELRPDSQLLIQQLNALSGYKIACDIPSGISIDGQITTIAFKADITLTMGALKSALFSELAKDHIGQISICDLGIDSSLYHGKTDSYLLEAADLKLPTRMGHNTHKGTYGHVSIIIGEKHGAGLLAAEAAFAFGAGLVTTVSEQQLATPPHLMNAIAIPNTASAVAIGMGLGDKKDPQWRQRIKLILDSATSKVIDADLFYQDLIITTLKQDNLVLTPHPKEFCALLKLCKLAQVSTTELQANRFHYVRKFCTKYPSIVLLLKGANTLIARDKQIYINPLGTNRLSKGGSGDVLSGLITSLLAQGELPLDAAINASLAHALAASGVAYNNYALSPMDIIEEVKKL